MVVKSQYECYFKEGFMKDFFSYFFGAGTEVEFKNFTLAHFLPIIIMLGIITLIIIYGKKIKEWKHESKLRLGLAFLLIITEMSYFWRLVGVESLNANPVDHLPITLCGWAIIFCSYLVVTKNQSLFDIAYFWVFTGSIFGLITPTVITYTGPTRFRYYQFWLEHTLGFITLFYMMFVHGMRPNFKSMIKSACALLVLVAIAMLANSMLPGANYLYIATTEETASVLDILPKNYAVKLLVMALIIGTLFFLAYLPWFIKDIKTKKALAVATANSTQVASAEQAKEENIKEETKSNVDLDSGLNKIESKTTKKSSTKSIKDNRSNKTNKN